VDGTANIGGAACCWCIVSDMSSGVAETQAENIRKKTLIDGLYRKYSQALRKFLVRRHVPSDDVADVVQETYCRVLKSGEVERIRHPKAFLFRVANNVVLNAARHRRIGVEDDAMEIEGIEVSDEEPSAYRRLKAEQELAIVRAALKELTPKCREVFVLNRFEHLSYADIAAELDLSVSMIEKYVSQALSYLRKRVADADAGRKNLHLLKFPQ
jgi:RNA polymerase sigma-70 factor (ECF subfamily)